MIPLYRIRNILLFIGLVSLIWGCNPPVDSSPKPVVVRKRVIAPTQPMQTQEKPASQKTESASKKQTLQPKPAEAEKKADIKKPKQDKPGKPLPTAPPKETESRIPEDKFPPLYSSKGKIDPFVPLIKQPGDAGGKKRKKVKRRVPRTPLEKMDLSQLKLVAIIRAPNGSKAMVEESGGKGYIIAKGTYIGLNSGRVVEILKDRLIIEEEVENVFGKITIRKRELKLQKPPGAF